MSNRPDTITLKVLSSFQGVTPTAWDACAGHNNPFVRYGFLSALEDSGSANAETGWMAQHLIIENEVGNLLAAAPLYLKNHSYGEYVFDWGWADAYERVGGQYYPKLQCAVPFTPVTGPRLLVSSNILNSRANKLRSNLATSMIQLAEKLEISSVHITFPERSEWNVMGELGYMQRIGQQFYWENKDYQSFDDFLGTLASRKRKQLRKERQKVADLGLGFHILRGIEIREMHWDSFYRFYRNTTDKKWGPSYLTREFFSLLGERLGDDVILIIAESDGLPVAGALNLIGGNTIFGRNWGCDAEYKFLHFETCYYQAIEFAIKHGLKWVEAGAQGSHKIQRGYMPTKTYSSHWVVDPALRQGIQNFLHQERKAVSSEMAALAKHSPYRQTIG